MKKILLFVMIAALLFGCQEKIIEKEVLHFRITWKAYSGRGEAVQRIVDAFNASQEDYEIVVDSGDEDLAAIQSDLSNDRFQIYALPYRYVQSLGDQNKLAEIQFSFGQQHISQALIQLGSIDNRLYGVPWVNHAMVLLYNQDLLASQGISPDEITDKTSFVTVLETLKQNGITGIGLVGADHNDLSWMVNQFIYGNHGTLVQDQQITINSKAAAEGIAYYMETLSQYAQPTWQQDTGLEVMTYFRDQEIAFEIQGPWGITDIWKNGNPFSVGVIPLKRIGANAEIGPIMLAMPTSLDEKKKGTIESFIQYMTDLPAQEMIMQGEYSPEHDAYFPFRLPVRDDIITTDQFDPNGIFEPFIASYDAISIDVPSPEWQQIKEELYTPYLHMVATGNMTITQLLTRLATEGQKLMEDKDE